MSFSFSTDPSLGFNISRWERLLYDARRMGGLEQKEGKIAADLLPHRQGDDQYEQVTAESRTFGAEVFSRLYADPEAVEGAAGWAPTAHKILDQLPEWGALREAVNGDPDFSALAAMQVMETVGERLPGLLKKLEEKKQGGQDQQDQAGGPLAGEDGPSVPGAEELGEAGAAIRSALRKAISRAGEEVAQAREAMAGLAPGSEYAPPTHKQEDPSRLKLAQSLLKRPDIREVVRRAGKLVRLAQRRDLVVDPEAKGEVVGLEQGADLGRVLPSALVLLDDEDLDVLFYKSFAERALPQYKVQGKEPQGKGPILVLLDESGSMNGDPEKWAKAAAIACMSVGRKEKRDVIVAFFTTRISDAWIQTASGDVYALDTRKGEKVGSQKESTFLAMEICTRGSDGGTNFSQPLQWSMNLIEKSHPKADILFVTDGQAEASPEIQARIEAARAKGLRIYGLTVNGGSISYSMQPLCTAIVSLDAPNVEDRILQAIPKKR